MPPPDDALTTNDQRIAWVLAHPGTSAWLKDALRAARERDPVEVLNELEILNLLLRADCEGRIRLFGLDAKTAAADPLVDSADVN